LDGVKWTFILITINMMFVLFKRHAREMIIIVSYCF
jgi:hypothetical protein